MANVNPKQVGTQSDPMKTESEVAGSSCAGSRFHQASGAAHLHRGDLAELVVHPAAQVGPEPRPFDLRHNVGLSRRPISHERPRGDAASVGCDGLVHHVHHVNLLPKGARNSKGERRGGDRPLGAQLHNQIEQRVQLPIGNPLLLVLLLLPLEQLGLQLDQAIQLRVDLERDGLRLDNRGLERCEGALDVAGGDPTRPGSDDAASCIWIACITSEIAVIISLAAAAASSNCDLNCPLVSTRTMYRLFPYDSAMILRAVTCPSKASTRSAIDSAPRPPSPAAMRAGAAPSSAATTATVHTLTRSHDRLLTEVRSHAAASFWSTVKSDPNTGTSVASEFIAVAIPPAAAAAMPHSCCAALQ